MHGGGSKLSKDVRGPAPPAKGLDPPSGRGPTRPASRGAAGSWQANARLRRRCCGRSPSDRLLLADQSAVGGGDHAHQVAAAAERERFSNGRSTASSWSTSRVQKNSVHSPPPSSSPSYSPTPAACTAASSSSAKASRSWRSWKVPIWRLLSLQTTSRSCSSPGASWSSRSGSGGSTIAGKVGSGRPARTRRSHGGLPSLGWPSAHPALCCGFVAWPPTRKRPLARPPAPSPPPVTWWSRARVNTT